MHECTLLKYVYTMLVIKMKYFILYNEVTECTLMSSYKH